MIGAPIILDSEFRINPADHGKGTAFDEDGRGPDGFHPFEQKTAKEACVMFLNVDPIVAGGTPQADGCQLDYGHGAVLILHGRLPLFKDRRECHTANSPRGGG